MNFQVEWMGLLATVFIMFSFLSSNKSVIRIGNSIGSIFFVIYGLIIGAWSVWILNGSCLLINLVKLIKERKE